jgi:hypothetical protein
LVRCVGGFLLFSAQKKKKKPRDVMLAAGCSLFLTPRQGINGNLTSPRAATKAGGELHTLFLLVLLLESARVAQECLRR